MKNFKMVVGFCAVVCAASFVACSDESSLEAFGLDLDEAVLDSELYLSSYLAAHSSSSAAVSSSAAADTVSSDSLLSDTNSAEADTTEADTLAAASSGSEAELSSSAADSSSDSEASSSSGEASGSADTLSVEIPVYESYSTYATLEAGNVYRAQVSADAAGCTLMCGANSSGIVLTVDGDSLEGDYAVYATLASPCAGETYVMQINKTANCYMAN